MKHRNRRWIRQHPITKVLLRGAVLKGEVADLGCGDGTRTNIAGVAYPDTLITGFDKDLGQVLWARTRNARSNVRFYRANLLKIPRNDNTFDNAYMLAVIEHIWETAALIAEIGRVVKPNGKLLVSVTNLNAHTDPGHVHIFGVRLLRKVFADHKTDWVKLDQKSNIIFAQFAMRG